MTALAPPAAGSDERSVHPLDLRLPALAVVAWGSALATLLLPRWSLLLLVLAALLLSRRARRTPTLAAWWVAAVGVGTIAVLRVDAVAGGPVADLARERAVVRVELVTTSDAVVRDGTFGDVVVLRARVLETTGRGERHTARAPVLVLAGEEWADVPLGSTVRTTGRLAPPRSQDLAAVVQPRGPPVVVRPAGIWWRGAEKVRAGIREAVSGRAAAPRALVPALVAGDDTALPAEVVEDFQVSGLTHLLAVSGTNVLWHGGSREHCDRHHDGARVPARFPGP